MVLSVLKSRTIVRTPVQIYPDQKCPARICTRDQKWENIHKNILNCHSLNSKINGRRPKKIRMEDDLNFFEKLE
jgi:hypothetical protein